MWTYKTNPWIKIQIRKLNLVSELQLMTYTHDSSVTPINYGLNRSNQISCLNLGSYLWYVGTAHELWVEL